MRLACEVKSVTLKKTSTSPCPYSSHQRISTYSPPCSYSSIAPCPTTSPFPPTTVLLLLSN